MKKLKLFMLALALMLVVTVKVSATECTEDCLAQIGDVKYATLQEAVDAVPTDGTETLITVLRDADETPSFVSQEGKKYTIDFDGHTLTFKDGTLVGSKGTESQNMQLLKNSTIVFKNGTLYSSTDAAMMLQNYANLTLEDMTLDSTRTTRSGSYTMSNNYGKVDIVGDTSILSNNIAFDMCWAPLVGNGSYAGGTQITLDTTGTVKGDIELDVWGTYADDVKSTLVIKNVNHEGDFLIDSRLKSSLTIYAGTFTSEPDTETVVETSYVVTTEDEEPKYVVVENQVLGNDESPVILYSEEPLPANYELVVEEASEEVFEDAKKEVTEEFKNNKDVKDPELLALYDITVQSDQDVVELKDGNFVIFLNVDSKLLKYDNYKVLYFDEDGKVKEELEVYKLSDLLKGGMKELLGEEFELNEEELEESDEDVLVFVTSHLSTYGVVGYNDVKEDNPNTGDNLILYIVLGMLSLATAIVALKKFAKNN